jgi:hypothetical protein
MHPIGQIARLKPVVRNEEDLDALGAGARHYSMKVVEQLHFLRDRLDTRPELAAFAEEVVVGVH